jgi:hypothetical protein
VRIEFTGIEAITHYLAAATEQFHCYSLAAQHTDTKQYKRRPYWALMLLWGYS